MADRLPAFAHYLDQHVRANIANRREFVAQFVPDKPDVQHHEPDYESSQARTYHANLACMAVYIVTYDLSNPGRDYNNLIAKIKAIGQWAHISESTWTLNSDASAAAVRNYLATAIDQNDKLFVGTLGHEAAWSGLDPDVSRWLKAHL